MATTNATDIMFSLKLPRRLYDAISELANADRRSKAFVVRDALDSYLSARSDTHVTGKSTSKRNK